MTEQEYFSSEKKYREHEAVNYSNLAKFAIGTDYVDLKFEEKKETIYGKMFELLIHDVVKGTSLFVHKFFVSDKIKNDISQNILTAYNSDNFSESITMFIDKCKTKAGSVKSNMKDQYQQLIECQEQEYKMPCSLQTYTQLSTAIDNFMNMTLVKMFNNVKVEDLLKKADFQVPFFWQNHEGIEKKGLVDCIVSLVCQNIKTSVVIDFKTSATPGHFFSMLRKKYKIQEQQYIEGANYCLNHDIYPQMIFLVSYREPPFNAQQVTINSFDSQNYKYEYQDLCREYWEWLQNGKQKKGHLKAQEIRLFYNK